MLDKEDLKAIGELMKDQKKEIINEVKTLIDLEVTPKFNLLADDIKTIRETMATKEDIQELKETIEAHSMVLKTHSQDITDLKKAQ